MPKIGRDPVLRRNERKEQRRKDVTTVLALLIIACEIGFWVFVLTGLIFRYVLKMPKTGLAFLIATPIIDLILLIATGIDLQNGATATFIHGLSAVYIGVSVAYGHRMIRWADGKFAQRFNFGPAPAPKPKYGSEHAAYERKMWMRHLAAWAIGCLLMFALIAWVGDAERTKALLQTVRTWTIVLAIDFAISFSYTIWPRKPKES
jgi:hypothetical protein